MSQAVTILMGRLISTSGTPMSPPFTHGAGQAPHFGELFTSTSGSPRRLPRFLHADGPGEFAELEYVHPGPGSSSEGGPAPSSFIGSGRGEPLRSVAGKRRGKT
jgi:hypothetical protein